MKISGREIGKLFKPYIVAEISANHGGSIERAKRTIHAAARCGVDAVKIQSYTPDTMTIKDNKKDFYIKEGLWAGRSLYNLYQEAHTPFEWHEELFECASNEGVTIFSTPFDETAVDLLDSLETPAFKVASFELIDLPLLRYIASKKKPILISTGMGSLEEIEEAVSTIKECNNQDILLFHCISSYPAPTNESNLSNLKFLKNQFSVEVGLSDHTLNNVAAITAVGMGAVAVEKHFKLDDTDCGPDSTFSLTPPQMSKLVQECSEAWTAQGQDTFSRSKIEEKNTVFRRSLYFIQTLKKGEKVKRTDIRRIRPGYGLKPKFFDNVLGKTLVKDVESGDPVKWDCFHED